jgi:hypothetical protein
MILALFPVYYLLVFTKYLASITSFFFYKAQKVDFILSYLWKNPEMNLKLFITMFLLYYMPP